MGQVVDASAEGDLSKSRIATTLEYDITYHRWDSVIVFMHISVLENMFLVFYSLPVAAR